MRRGFFCQMLWLGPALAEEVEHRRRVEEIIDFLKIQYIRKIPVGKLPLWFAEARRAGPGAGDGARPSSPR
jgi:hypothetical protein